MELNPIVNQGVILAATVGIKEIVKTAVSSYIKPKLEKYLNNSKNVELVEDIINEYLERSYNNCETMNTIVFKNGQKKIDDLYIPLTVIKSDNKDIVKICINKYRDDFIPVYKKVLLVDNAGMGKSTIIKYLFLSSIKERKGIPILIELRKLDKDDSIINFIMNEIKGINQYLDVNNIIDLIKEGDFIFYFDGYDEITSEAKKNVTENLQKFITQTSNNTFIISSRDEKELIGFGDFQRFDIQPLKKEEAYSLIKKYDNYDEISKKLIDELETKENMNILKEFLENPLMVSLLYKSYAYKRTIPMKKNLFYRQVYDALYEEHDLAKGGAYSHYKKSQLDLEDFHRVLRSIGFITLAKGVSYSKENFVCIIQQAKRKNADLQFNENDFINDVTISVPIFIKEGIEYKWTHKSFQEYFAAAYIYSDAREKQVPILTKMVTNHNIYKYYNILDFYYDIDYKQFSRVIINPIIKELEIFYNDKYNSNGYNDYDKKDVLVRKQLLFTYKNIMIRKLSEEEHIKCKMLEHRELFHYFFEKKDIRRSSICNDVLGICFDSNVIEILLKLLNNKKSKIVDEIKFNFNTLSESCDKLITMLESGKYEVNDCIENRLNDKDIFNIVNKFIIFRKNECGNLVVFNYDKCIELNEQISKEIMEEKNDINFL